MQGLNAKLQQARAWFDVVHVAVVAVDATGKIVLVNRRAGELLGWSPTELIDRNWFESVIPERARAGSRSHLDRILAGWSLEQFEGPVVTRSGEERSLVWHPSALRSDDGRVVGMIVSGDDVTARDISDRESKQSTRMLAEFKFALDQSAIVATTDRKGLITYANDKFCEISKYSREELLGKDHRILNSGLHPKEFMHNLWRTISSGKIWRGEIRNRAKDGSHYWVDTTIVPFLGSDGAPYQYLAIRADITERKRAQDALLEQESLAMLGQMAAVVAHEVKNPLAGISGVIQVLADRFPDPSTEREMIAAVLARTESLNKMIEDLLVFARPRAPKIARVDLLFLLREAKSLLADDPNHREVVVELPNDAPALWVDPDLLQPVFFNLFLNASQAMKSRGRIRVSTSSWNDACRIAFADDGPGIPAEIREKVFDPFFTTKHRGTGLGLAIAKRVIGAHGGEIAVDCPPDGGTTFLVTLPLARG
ncbi:MAG: PAS domain S-box protein [Planctomycetes bacterium]|nr:PAS domain S-box protein [Planctomycetota bacterium]